MDQWVSVITANFPNLTKPQAFVLALWSFGMVLAKSCGLTSVVNILAPFLSKDRKRVQQKRNSLRQRLRQWCYNAEDKTGKKRRELETESCFPFLLRWVMRLWKGKQLALALDATALSDCFTVLAISVLYRGCAIPVAWEVLKGNEKQAWRSEWLRMLRLLKPGIPDDMMVIVLSDRGLYATWLYRRIQRLGWHPFMRKSVVGTFRPDCGHYFHPISSFAMYPGIQWSGHGTLFKTKGKQLKCTLLAYWDEEAKEAWFIITDLSPEACDACWYGMRAWIEHGFKLIKRGGWQWHRTRMRDPERAARLWLAVSVATLWLVNVGGEADEAIPEGTIPDITKTLRSRKATRLRMVSVFRQGWVTILMSLIFHEPLPLGRFIPEPWPRFPHVLSINHTGVVNRQ